MFENEEWRQVHDLPHYLISNYGRVRKDGSTEARKVSVSDKGFLVLTLYGADSKTRYLRQVNKLVADAFLDPPIYPDETAVWHIDGDLRNCRADNLKWARRSQVIEWNDMHRTGRPAYNTERVRNNRTGLMYANAFECAMHEGQTETYVVTRVEKQARHPYDPAARYMYVRDGDATYD